MAIDRAQLKQRRTGFWHETRGALWGGGLAIGSFLLAVLHIEVVRLEYIYPLASLIVGACLVRDRATGAYMEFVLWTWVVCPEVRRVVDWHSAYHSTNPITLAGAVATLVCIPQVVSRWRRRPATTLTNSLLVVGGVTIYGLLVGILRVGFAAAGAAFFEAFSPVVFGLYLLVCGPPAAVVRETLRRFFLAAVIVLGGYALVQFLVLPGWDKFWMENAQINSVGEALPDEVRVFSLLNSPAPFATFVVCALVPIGAVRSKWRWVGLVLGFGALGLSLVRAAWIGWLVSTVALLGRRAKSGRRLGLRLLLIPVVLLIVIGGPIEHVIIQRLSATASNGTKDGSLQARLAEYGTYLPEIATDPVGEGLGSTGSITKLANGGQIATTGSFDGGFLVVGYEYGLIGGLIVVVAIGSAIAACRRICPDDDEFAVGCVAVLLGLVAQALFSDVTDSVPGLALWAVIAYVGLARFTEDGISAKL